MRKCLLVIIPLMLLGCSKGQKDSTYTYYCTRSYQVDPLFVYTIDTILYNVTDNEANNYARGTSVNGWTTNCQKH